MVQLGRARTLFSSADSSARVVGATADLLLEGDEAQDIAEETGTKDFSRMAASTNATTVLCGTAWTSDTLLAMTIQHLQQQQTRDGIRRVFQYDAGQVAAYVPAYGRYVRRQVARLGRGHPLIKTQYYLETIDTQTGLFPPALNVVEVEARRDALPLYRVVDRRLWLGIRHTALFDQITTLAEHWRAGWVVVDATGIGARLASFLAKALPGRVIPVVFSSSVKVQLGWGFVGAVETGRFKDYVDDGQPETRQFCYEVEHCAYEVLPAPGERIRWGVWEAPGYAGLVARGHDDLLVSAALCTVLDERLWPGTGSAEIVRRADPLDEIDGAGW